MWFANLVFCLCFGQFSSGLSRKELRLLRNLTAELSVTDRSSVVVGNHNHSKAADSISFYKELTTTDTKRPMFGVIQRRFKAESTDLYVVPHPLNADVACQLATGFHSRSTTLLLMISDLLDGFVQCPLTITSKMLLFHFDSHSSR